jgi:hypothetical protein
MRFITTSFGYFHIYIYIYEYSMYSKARMTAGYVISYKIRNVTQVKYKRIYGFTKVKALGLIREHEAITRNHC